MTTLALVTHEDCATILDRLRGTAAKFLAGEDVDSGCPWTGDALGDLGILDAFLAAYGHPALGRISEENAAAALRGLGLNLDDAEYMDELVDGDLIADGWAVIEAVIDMARAEVRAVEDAWTDFDWPGEEWACLLHVCGIRPADIF